MAIAIPQYALYGEATQDVDERFLHAEPIAERSRLHNWKIRPHAHRDLHHLLLVQRGGGTFHAEGSEYVIATPALIEVPLSCVHSFEFLPGTDGWIVTTSGTLMSRLMREHPSINSVLHDAGILRLTNAHTEIIADMFDHLVAEFRGHLPARRSAAEAWLTHILIQTLRSKLDLAPDAQRPVNADVDLVARYRVLIEANFSKQLRIADYAERLCVGHERLRQACVHSTGSSPLELLNGRRLLEAKRSLLYTGLSVVSIAEFCGFSDPAYFSRFFTRATGYSPRAYRKTQGARQRDD